MGQHEKVTISGHKSVPAVILPIILLGCKQRRVDTYVWIIYWITFVATEKGLLRQFTAEVYDVSVWARLPKLSDHFVLLLFYVLATSKVISCDFIVLPHHPIPHSVTLCWHWAYQSLSYPNNVEHLARKWQVSIFYVIGLTQPGFEFTISRTRDSALPIRPPRPV